MTNPECSLTQLDTGPGTSPSPWLEVSLSLWLMAPRPLRRSSLTLCRGGRSFRSALVTSTLCRPFQGEVETVAWRGANPRIPLREAHAVWEPRTGQYRPDLLAPSAFSVLLQILKK